MIWSDVDARARGLATRLIGGPRLRQWASAPDLARLISVAIATRAQDEGTVPSTQLQVSVLARGMASLVSVRLAVLREWAGSRAGALDALFEDDERRAVRALVRGAAIGLPASACLEGLVPTPALRQGVLEALAVEPTVARLAAALVQRHNAYGPALFAETGRSRPHLLALEHCLDRVYAERVGVSARHADAPLADYARFLIDVQNCWWAVCLAGLPTRQERAEPIRWFLRGGRSVTASAYARAIDTASRAAAAAMLATLFPRTPLAASLRSGESVDALEDAAIATALTAARVAARAEPLGTGPIISYVLRQRAELRDVHRLLWGRALGAPADRLGADIVSP